MIPRKLNNFIDKDNLKLHFIKDLVGNDRRLRFGGSLSDEAIETYLKSSF